MVKSVLNIQILPPNEKYYRETIERIYASSSKKIS